MPNYGVKGTQLQISIASSYTAVGQLQMTDAPPMKMGTRDVTHLGSTVKECEATIGDPQEFKATLIYDPTNQAARLLETRVTTPSTVLGGDSFKVVLPTTTKYWDFQAIVTEFTPKGGDVEGTWMAEIGLKASRAITLPTTS